MAGHLDLCYLWCFFVEHFLTLIDIWAPSAGWWASCTGIQGPASCRLVRDPLDEHGQITYALLRTVDAIGVLVAVGCCIIKVQMVFLTAVRLCVGVSVAG